MKTFLKTGVYVFTTTHMKRGKKSVFETPDFFFFFEKEMSHPFSCKVTACKATSH